MPNESIDISYRRGYPKGLPVVSSDPLTDKDRIPFSEEELAMFDARFEAIFGWMNVQGWSPIVTKKHYESILYLAEVQKKIFGGSEFTGDGVNGWGMRDIVPEDIYGDSNPGTGIGATGGDDCWELGNGVTAANWTSGAVATRFTRNDIGWTTRDTATFQAGNSMVCLDVNQDRWAVAYFGMADLAGTGLVQGHVVAFSNRERDFFEFTNQQQLMNLTYGSLGKVIYLNHLAPFKSGHIIRPATVAPGAAVGNALAMRPIGVSFVTQRRALQLATLLKPSQA